MSYVVVGVEYLDYVSRKTGKPVQGVNLYCASPIDSKRGCGDRVEKFYIGQSYIKKVFDGVKPEDILHVTIDILYNRYGNIETILLVR